MNMKLHFYMLFFFMLFLAACQRPALEAPFVLEELSKNQRELLGKRLELALLTQPDIYPLRSSAGAENETLFKFIQAYFDQASFFYHRDRRSPSDNRWNQNKQWRVRILASNTPQSFCFPGGDFYISEGMLRLLKNEAELYSLMSFELTLMQEKIMLEELAEQYVAEDFIDLLELGSTKGGLNRQDLLISFFEITYEDYQLFEIDKLTIKHVCDSSAFFENALENCIQSIDQGNSNNWIAQKSYPGRIENIRNFPSLNNCGNRTTNGSYQSQVLDYL